MVKQGRIFIRREFFKSGEVCRSYMSDYCGGGYDGEVRALVYEQGDIGVSEVVDLDAGESRLLGVDVEAAAGRGVWVAMGLVMFMIFLLFLCDGCDVCRTGIA